MSATKTETSTAIEVVAEVPASPIVVIDGGIVARIGELRESAIAIDVKDAESEQQAANLLNEATSLARDVESSRKAIKEPYLKIGRQIDEKAKAVLQELDAAKAGVRKSLNAYQTEQERIRQEQERKRQEEARRLEQERIRKEEELARAKAKAEAEAAEQAELPDLDSDESDDDELPDFGADVIAEQTEAELKRIDEQIAATNTPAVTAPKAAGIAYRKQLVVKQVNVERLPERFVIKSPDTAAIRKEYCVGWDPKDGVPSVPGVEFEVKQTPVSSGRR